MSNVFFRDIDGGWHNVDDISYFYIDQQPRGTWNIFGEKSTDNKRCFILKEASTREELQSHLDKMFNYHETMVTTDNPKTAEE